MSAFSTYYNPILGRLPGVISLAMLIDFLRCLPRPPIGAPLAYGRQMIQDALASVDAFGPRDRLEAMLVLPIPTLLLAAREMEAAAAADPDLDRRMRLRRQMMALQRRAEALGAEVRRHRRELARRDVQHVPPQPAWEFDLDALEAAWRDPEAVLQETALMAAPLEYPAGWGPTETAVADVVPAAVVAVPVEVGLDGTLEGRAEFDAVSPSGFQRVPTWKQAGRPYPDELAAKGAAARVEAPLARGEVIEAPPRQSGAGVEPQGGEAHAPVGAGGPGVECAGVGSRWHAVASTRRASGGQK